MTKVPFRHLPPASLAPSPSSRAYRALQTRNKRRAIRKGCCVRFGSGFARLFRCLPHWREARSECDSRELPGALRANASLFARRRIQQLRGRSQVLNERPQSVTSQLHSTAIVCQFAPSANGLELPPAVRTTRLTRAAAVTLSRTNRNRPTRSEVSSERNPMAGGPTRNPR
jgi:hypothetical protein